jgi:hypothetical protein
MIKNLLKVCVSNAPKSPRAGAALTPRNYVTEANEYVYNISHGHIAGVNPACVDEDAVCCKILREINGGAEMESSEIHIVGKIWLTQLSMNEDKVAMNGF